MIVKRQWTIVSNHGLVIVYLSLHPDSTAREVSDALGITERQVFRILNDLDDADIVNIQRRRGRRNSYSVNLDATFRHPVLSNLAVRRVVQALAPALLDGTHSGPPETDQ